MLSIVFIQSPNKRPSAADCLSLAYAFQDPNSENFQATSNQAVNLFDSFNLNRMC